MIECPLNYTGNKAKLIDQILPMFPADIHRFVDLFCGGGTVGINVNADEHLYNDSLKPLISLYNTFLNTDIETLISDINSVIDKYKLSKENKEGYLELRKHYNESRNDIEFYTLLIYCFSNIMRFNKKGEFNQTFGKRNFNPKLERKLRIFVDELKSQNAVFTSKDFEEFKAEPGDFIYLDPPYLISDAGYNGHNWTTADEKRLYRFLDNLDCKFALSNVLEHKGEKNDILIDWSKKYNIHYLNADYHRVARNTASQGTIEVLITNY